MTGATNVPTALNLRSGPSAYRCYGSCEHPTIGEVEDLLAGHPAVLDAAVGLPDQRLGGHR